MDEFEESFAKEEIHLSDGTTGAFYNRKKNDIFEMAIVSKRGGMCLRCHGYPGGESLIFLTSVSLKEYASEKYDLTKKTFMLISAGILILGIFGPLITGYLTQPIFKDLQTIFTKVHLITQDSNPSALTFLCFAVFDFFWY